jgi:predicted RNase H-like HicB family nuclease
MRIDDYVDRPYLIELVYSEDEEGQRGWVAEVAELPGCIAQGETPDAAVQAVRDAMTSWIAVALEDGKTIPEPRQEVTHSGRLLLRMPRTLHAQLADEAEHEGVSLNQFVTASLAGAVGWRSRDRGAVPA